jgi:hypothetical protein
VKVYTIDPIHDPRWGEFVEREASACVFHSVPWLEAIRRTYGYSPIAYTTCPPSAPLSNGVVFCRIRSWITGSRMVSLPFSDHCEPLLDNSESFDAIAQELNREFVAGNWKYIELRPKNEVCDLDGVTKASSYHLHELGLGPTKEELLRRTHKSCIQASIRRAERDGIEYESGNSERLLRTFYRLMVQTRRRQKRPPQPIQWFRNLVACTADRLQIRVASHQGTAIASILTLQHGSTVVYKYGCSDSQFNNLGGTPFLFWKMIVEAKQAGMTSVDFGRSDTDNPGLITFKNRWGTKLSQLTYWRWSREPAEAPARSRSADVMKRLFAVMPDPVLEATGRILYRHIG